MKIIKDKILPSYYSLVKKPADISEIVGKEINLLDVDRKKLSTMVVGKTIFYDSFSDSEFSFYERFTYVDAGTGKDIPGDEGIRVSHFRQKDGDKLFHLKDDSYVILTPHGAGGSIYSKNGVDAHLLKYLPELSERESDPAYDELDNYLKSLGH